MPAAVIQIRWFTHGWNNFADLILTVLSKTANPPNYLSAIYGIYFFLHFWAGTYHWACISQASITLMNYFTLAVLCIGGMRTASRTALTKLGMVGSTGRGEWYFSLCLVACDSESLDLWLLWYRCNEWMNMQEWKQDKLSSYIAFPCTDGHELHHTGESIIQASVHSWILQYKPIDSQIPVVVCICF